MSAKSSRSSTPSREHTPSREATPVRERTPSREQTPKVMAMKIPFFAKWPCFCLLFALFAVSFLITYGFFRANSFRYCEDPKDILCRKCPQHADCTSSSKQSPFRCPSGYQKYDETCISELAYQYIQEEDEEKLIDNHNMLVEMWKNQGTVTYEQLLGNFTDLEIESVTAYGKTFEFDANGIMKIREAPVSPVLPTIITVILFCLSAFSYVYGLKLEK